MNFTNPKLTAAKLAIAKNPKSKATALRWYLKDHIGLLHNQATAELWDSFAQAVKEVKGRNVPAIVEICRDCVGDGADGNCRIEVRNCEINDCLLFNVRPYQSKSKVSPEYASPRAFLTGIASEVIERPTPTNNPSKKRILPNIAIDCFSLGK
jgi:hypothetical protein